MSRRIFTAVGLVVAVVVLTACGPTRTQGQSTSVTSSTPPAATGSVLPPSPSAAPKLPDPGAIKSGLRSIGYTEQQQVEFMYHTGFTLKGVLWTSQQPGAPEVILYATGDDAGQIALLRRDGLWCELADYDTFDRTLIAFQNLAAYHRDMFSVEPGKLDYGTPAVKFICGKA